MVGTVPRISAAQTQDRTVFRNLLLGGAAVRAVAAIVAIPLAAALYREHIAGLVFLRPTKDVFLFSGFQLREGNVSLPVVVLVALPILLGGVWLFYGLGRLYGDELCEKELPGLAGRILPKDRVNHLRDVLEERGSRVVFFGRLAAFPSTLMAAAAGASEVPFREFLIADTAGALASMAALLGIGFGLGEAYDDAGPWITGAGVAVLVGLLVVVGRWLSASGGGTATRKA